MKRVTAQESLALLDQGWVYIDVRTEEEFGDGHPVGALNIPLSLLVNGARAPNPDFLAAVEALFDKNSKLLLGCATGVRSLRAGDQLAAAGFTELMDNLDGWAGWMDLKLPEEKSQPDDRSWKGLLKRLQG